VTLSVLALLAAIAGAAAGALTGSTTTPNAAVHLRALLARAEQATVEVEAGTQKGPDGIYPTNDHDSEFGSGFFISPTEVMTAGHVVYTASKKMRSHRSPVYVLTPSGGRYPAHLAAVDLHDDVALLSVSGRPPVRPLTFAGKLPKVGEPMVAVGSPAGDWPSLTSGIISRAETATGDFANTGNVLSVALDLAASEGSSGAPVLNMQGEVAGMILEHDGSTGEPLQIMRPADVLRADLAQLRRGQTLSNPFDGATLVSVDPETRQALGLDSPHGLLVQRVEPGSALYSAEVRPGDELLALEGRPIDSLTAALEMLVKRTPAQALTLEYANHAGKQRATLIIEVGQAPT